MLSQKIIKLAEKKYSLLFKEGDEQSQIKIRLFCVAIKYEGCFCDGFVYDWECEESILLEIINELEKRLDNLIKEKIKFDETKKQRQQRQKIDTDSEDEFS